MKTLFWLWFYNLKSVVSDQRNFKPYIFGVSDLKNGVLVVGTISTQYQINPIYNLIKHMILYCTLE